MTSAGGDRIEFAYAHDLDAAIEVDGLPCLNRHDRFLPALRAAFEDQALGVTGAVLSGADHGTYTRHRDVVLLLYSLFDLHFIAGLSDHETITVLVLALRRHLFSDDRSYDDLAHFLTW